MCEKQYRGWTSSGMPQRHSKYQEHPNFNVMLNDDRCRAVRRIAETTVQYIKLCTMIWGWRRYRQSARWVLSMVTDERQRIHIIVCSLHWLSSSLASSAANVSQQNSNTGWHVGQWLWSGDKRQNVVWKHVSSSTRKKLMVTPSAGKVVYAIFGGQ